MNFEYKNLATKFYNSICLPFMMIELETKENIFVINYKIINSV